MITLTNEYLHLQMIAYSYEHDYYGATTTAVNDHTCCGSTCPTCYGDSNIAYIESRVEPAVVVKIDKGYDLLRDKAPFNRFNSTYIMAIIVVIFRIRSPTIKV